MARGAGPAGGGGTATGIFEVFLGGDDRMTLTSWSKVLKWVEESAFLHVDICPCQLQLFPVRYASCCCASTRRPPVSVCRHRRAKTRNLRATLPPEHSGGRGGRGGKDSAPILQMLLDGLAPQAFMQPDSYLTLTKGRCGSSGLCEGECTVHRVASFPRHERTHTLSRARGARRATTHLPAPVYPLLRLLRDKPKPRA